MSARQTKSRVEYNRAWRHENPEKVKTQRERQRVSRAEHLRKWREKVKADPALRRQQAQKASDYHRRKKIENPAYAEKSKARAKRYYEKIKADPERAERLRLRSREQYHARKADAQKHGAYLVQSREYRRLRKLGDPEFAIKSHLRARLSDLVGCGRCKRDKSAITLTGATIEELRRHIEKQFRRGMSWDNYGAWHIDHIIPCSKFDLTDPRQQAICFNYLNLRPLWAKENLRKNNRILEDSQIPLGI